MFEELIYLNNRNINPSNLCTMEQSWMLKKMEQWYYLPQSVAPCGNAASTWISYARKSSIQWLCCKRNEAQSSKLDQTTFVSLEDRTLKESFKIGYKQEGAMVCDAKLGIWILPVLFCGRSQFSNERITKQVSDFTVMSWGYQPEGMPCYVRGIASEYFSH